MAPFQIEVGIKQLAELHPLKETVDWRDINRCFCCCKITDRIKKRWSERQSLIKAIVDFDETSEDDSDFDMGEEQTLEEKFLIAGFGVKAFFDITSLIMKMLAFITIVYAPVFYIYY